MIKPMFWRLHFHIFIDPHAHSLLKLMIMLLIATKRFMFKFALFPIYHMLNYCSSWLCVCVCTVYVLISKHTRKDMDTSPIGGLYFLGCLHLRAVYFCWWDHISCWSGVQVHPGFWEVENCGKAVLPFHSGIQSSPWWNIRCLNDIKQDIQCTTLPVLYRTIDL